MPSVFAKRLATPWGWTWVAQLSQDLGYALRQLKRSPGFTLAAVLMLAIGIGVNVAAFGFFNLMALRPLPVRSPAPLLRFKRRAPASYAWAPRVAASRANYLLKVCCSL